jgi:hypothetical protein
VTDLHAAPPRRASISPEAQLLIDEMREIGDRLERRIVRSLREVALVIIAEWLAICALLALMD